MKKKNLLLTIALLLVTMVMALTACGNSYGKIKNAFENKGYSEIEEVDEEYSQLAKELFGEEYADVCSVHVLKKANEGILIPDVYAVVLEFKSTKALEEKIKELANSEEYGDDFKDAVNDIQSLDFVNGNCFLLTFLTGTLTGSLEIFKGTK